MKIETVPIMGDNYSYLVICEQTGQAAAVDPADASTVALRARRLGVEITAIWTTHHHFDHCGGNQELALKGELRVFGHLIDRTRIPGLTDTAEHGDRLPLGKLQAQVYHTPGHTRGAICYHVEDALFSGDTLFGGGCGRLFEGDPPTMFASLATIAALPHPTRIYFGHEYTAHNLAFAATLEPDNEDLQRRLEAARQSSQPTTPSTLAEELATNPFLRSDSPQILHSLGQKFPDDDWTALQAFTRIRQLRNSW